MKFALATTTINTPQVLALYGAYGPNVKMFVAGDTNTPQAAYDFCDSIPNCVAGRPTSQSGWKCSELLGWESICRRNIALLEAVRSGADVILFTDDDNIPCDGTFFHKFTSLFSDGFDGVKVSSDWFDAGQLLTPTVRHRGIPIEVSSIQPRLDAIIDAQIGVAAGLWIGDADVNAVDRIANPPAVHSASALALAGVVVDPNTKTVFNAQNVAFIREVAPAMFQAPGLGRADDIFASLITQRIMRERGLHVHFGQPFTACWQDRSKASLLRDLSDEMMLLERTAEFANYLHGYELPDGTVVEQVRDIYADLTHFGWWPKIASEAAFAFFDDIEGVL